MTGKEPQIPPRTPAPGIVPVRAWPTPNKTDVLFYVERDATLPANKDWSFGDPYRASFAGGQGTYQNHKLVFVSEQTPDQWSRWYYAADREAQDLYNFQFTKADFNGTKFDGVRRSYLTSRADFDPAAPTPGSLMPNSPENKFPTPEEFILADRQQVFAQEQQLGSLYVMEELVYVKRVTITEVGIRERTGRGEFNVTTLYYKGEVASGSTTIEDLVTDQGNTYWGAQTDGSFRGVNQLSESWYAVTLRVFMDLEPDYRKSASRLKPGQFFCPQATVTTTTKSITTEGAPADPAPNLGEEITVEKSGTVQTVATTVQSGSPQPLPGLNALDDGFAYPVTRTLVLTSSVPSTRQEVESGGTITEFTSVDPCNSVAEERQMVSPETEYLAVAERLAPAKFYVQGLVTTSDVISFTASGEPTLSPIALNEQARVTVKGRIEHTISTAQLGSPVAVASTTFDERTGATFLETEEVVPQGDVAAGAIDSDGNLVTYRGVDANWAVKGTRNVASPDEITWSKIVNYEWPAVLTNFTFTSWTRKISGTVETLPDFTFKQGFSGPQKATVRQWWQLAPPTVTSPEQMIPEGATFNTPLLQFSIPPCLHGEIEAHCNIGSEDDEWESAYYSKTFPATNLTDWPETVVWVESNPYNGGYIVTEYTLDKPST